MLYTLLARTPHDLIKFTLLDLKRGVEVKGFEGFPNVTIAKNESDSVDELKKVVQEMDRRYKFLEDNKRKKIDPERDGKPLIVVAVDEASVIFGAKSKSSKLKELSDEARELCEKIAKLGRASGIHMILATQRATKTSIDTSTLDNLEARLCFRTRSVSGSTAILGDKSGSELPNIPGRAIWQMGVNATTLQVPFMPEDEFSEMCEDLKNERAREFGDDDSVDPDVPDGNLDIDND
jgi:DNA segregation ATPase FtsK/SpoIIIE-like protein